jgi:DNA polymerase III subunit epsilon
MRTNRFDTRCESCGAQVPEGSGLLLGGPGHWSTRCWHCRPVAPPRGDHDGWHRGPVAALDFETTGTDPFMCRIVSVGFVSQDGEEFSSLVNPGVPIPREASDVHGIHDADVADAPAPAVVLAEVSGLVAASVATGVPLAVCHAPFDLTLLNTEARRHGLPPVEFAGLRVVDPRVLDWAIEHGQQGPRGLGDLCRYYGVQLDDAHSAIADAHAVRSLAVEMAARHPILASYSLDAITRAQRGWYAEHADDWNSYARRAGRELDDPQGWPVRQDMSHGSQTG